MAAPATTALGTPAGIMMEDGHRTAIVFARLSTASFWETTLQPPSIDGGDPIKVTTMRNVTYQTKSARKLRELGDIKVTCGYDPNAYNQILSSLINQEGAATIHFPDNSTLDMYAYVRMFEPSEHQEGELPTADITIVVTNWDPVNRVEAAPVLTSVAGT